MNSLRLSGGSATITVTLVMKRTSMPVVVLPAATGLRGPEIQPRRHAFSGRIPLNPSACSPGPRHPRHTGLESPDRAGSTSHCRSRPGRHATDPRTACRARSGGTVHRRTRHRGIFRVGKSSPSHQLVEVPRRYVCVTVRDPPQGRRTQAGRSHRGLCEPIATSAWRGLPAVSPRILPSIRWRPKNWSGTCWREGEEITRITSLLAAPAPCTGIRRPSRWSQSDRISQEVWIREQKGTQTAKVYPLSLCWQPIGPDGPDMCRARGVADAHARTAVPGRGGPGGLRRPVYTQVFC